MPFMGGLLFIIQLAFAYHVIRTGRETYWIFIIMFIPGLGCLLYFVTQILPDLRGDLRVRRAGNQLLKAVDPQRELRQRREELELADTLENRLKLADECMEAGLHVEAIELIQQALNPANRDEPYILLKLAQAQFGAGQYQASVDTLDELIAANPNFRSPDGHLIYARSLEALGHKQEALEEYESLATAYPGEEGRARYADLLVELGQRSKAEEVWREMLLRSRRAPGYYRRKEKPWLKQAEQHLKHPETGSTS
ncbi:MAG: tetratricopeptide repeat protein [Thiothrix sp.]|nr:tetratricopeptide repeat protein [Thiothrix sp.]HPQ97264.1 tetratricopeptide repeat protein [Thiolinea sp.]